MSEIRSFFFEPKDLYILNLLRFFPPREAVEAKMKVKQCMDQIPKEDRERIYNVVVNCFTFSLGVSAQLLGQEGGQGATLWVLGGETPAPLLTWERVACGYRVDDDMTPAELD